MDRHLKVDLLIVDDMGLKTLPPKACEILLELVMRRYENRSTLMTSNRPIEEWGKLINDVPAAAAILDRFLHHAEVIQFTGKSYRLDRAARAQKAAACLMTKMTAIIRPSSKRTVGRYGDNRLTLASRKPDPGRIFPQHSLLLRPLFR